MKGVSEQFILSFAEVQSTGLKGAGGAMYPNHASICSSNPHLRPVKYNGTPSFRDQANIIVGPQHA
ncbi:hypothetical protein N7490_005477 [Penicillium lividum]|nr:hypothetical protein N7490_005477 [Penicillium lividum]